MFCSHCACELPAIAKFCVRCGSRVEGPQSPAPSRIVTSQTNQYSAGAEATCSTCGSHNPSDYAFCTSCGAPLGPATSRSIDSPTPPEVSSRIGNSSTPQVVQTETAQPSTLPVDDAADVNWKRATSLDSRRVPRGVYAAGNLVVVRRGSILPARCVKCGNTPTDPWPKISFSWHHPGYYLFIITPLIYVIVALIVRKTIKLSIPLCKAHKSIRTKRLWTATVLLVGCIPVPSILGVYVDNDAIVGALVWLGIGMFIAGLFFLVSATPLKTASISSEGAEFLGACREFLDGLNEISQDNMMTKN